MVYFAERWNLSVSLCAGYSEVSMLCVFLPEIKQCTSYSQVGGVFFIKPMQKINFPSLNFWREAFIQNKITWCYNLHVNSEDLKLWKSHWRIPYGSTEHPDALCWNLSCGLRRVRFTASAMSASLFYYQYINNPLKCHFFSLEMQDLLTQVDELSILCFWMVTLMVPGDRK